MVSLCKFGRTFQYKSIQCINRISIDKIPRKKDKDSTDRTGLLTVHPELLNQEGQITDEDLLTVRFSNELDPPESSNEEVL